MDFELVMSILLGAVIGGVQFWLLKLGVGSVVKGKIKVWPFVVQFLCPLAGLLLCAFVWRDQLVVCATAMCAVLIGGAIAASVAMALKKKKDGSDEKKV